VLHQRPYLFILYGNILYFIGSPRTVSTIPAVTTATAMAIHPPVIKAPASGRAASVKKFP